MEEYIEKLISQIRCMKARPYIEAEIRGHIEDQISANINEGMSAEEAEENAVLDMGDPIEVGISMDKIHKPTIAWKMVLVVGVVSVLAVLIQWKFVLNINNNIANFGSITHSTQVDGIFTADGGVIQNTMDYNYSIEEFVRAVVVGFVVMSLLYFLDYTFVAKYSRIIGSVMILSGIWTVIFGVMVNGTHYYLMNSPVSMQSFMMLYIPIYGGIIYKYRNGGLGSLCKCVVWLIVPLFITRRIPSLVVTVIMMICMLIQLSIAICKDWYKVNKKICLVSIWSIFLILPVVALFGMVSLNMLPEYQMDRIRVWLCLSKSEYDLLSVIREYTGNVPLIGKCTKDILWQLPDLNRDYVFTYVLNTYGSIVGIIMIAVLAVLILCVFGAVLKQKNELGLVIGSGCGMILLMNTIINILCAIGILPPTSSVLPFFSAGGSNLILCYAFLGIVISIYKYKDIYPADIKFQQTGEKYKLLR